MSIRPLRPRPGVLWCVLLAACLPGTPSGGSDASSPPRLWTRVLDLSRGVGWSGSDGSDDSGSPRDTDGGQDTDALPDTDRPVDTDTAAVDTDPPTPPRVPPTAWGGGFVEFGSQAIVASGFQVVPGDPAVPREAEHGVASFADLDHDGRAEIIVDNWIGARTTRAVRVFRYNAATATLDRRTALERDLTASPSDGFMGGMDLDDDGYDDLLDGGGPAIWWGRAGTGFTHTTQVDHAERLRGVTYRSTSVVDLDADGWLDLVAGSDQPGTVAAALQRTGARRFEARDDLIESATRETLFRCGHLILGDGSRAWLTLGDSDHASASSSGGFLVGASASAPADDTPRWVDVDLSPANATWKQSPASAGMPYTRASPMGGVTADFDGDLRPDLMLSLGHWALAGLHANQDRTYTDVPTVQLTVTQGVVDVPWGVVAPDLDGDGVADLLVAMGDHADSVRAAAGVRFPMRAYWGRGDLTFEDVTRGVGLGALGQWHGVVLEDLDGDADPDVAVSGYGVTPLIFRNNVNTGAGHMAIRLHGTTSNALGLGAVVEVEVDGLPTRMQLMGGEANVDALARPVLFFGLGAQDHAAVVRVRWPSGVTQEAYGLSAGGTYTLEEPPILSLSEADRHLMADGAATLTVTVRPRDAAGGPRSASSVVLALTGAPATWEGAPVEQPDGSWTATLRAPHAPGSTRVVATIDGAVVGIAPRVWWD